MPWLRKRIPRDVEPAVAGKELVGIFTGLEEGDEALELGGILGADVGSLSKKVLGVLDATNLTVHLGVTKARVDNDGATDGFACGLQQMVAAVGHVGNLLDGWDVLWILLQVAELSNGKVLRELDVIHCVFH